MSWDNDSYQQEAILANTNAIVSAGAGSGKTSVLASRFVRLVKEHRAGVEHILTLTFTRKAAAEMRDRIYRMLLADREDPHIEAELSCFNRAQISTLDSFCAQIVRNWPQRFGISSDFTLDDLQNRRLAEEGSLEFLLRKWDNRALSDFIYHNGFEETWKEVFTFLAADFISLASPGRYREMFSRQMEFLSGKLEETLKSLDETVALIGSLSSGISSLIDTAKQELARYPEMRRLLDREDFEPAGRGLLGLKMRKPGAVKKEELALYKDWVEQFRDTREVLLEIISTLTNRDLIQEMLVVCEEFEEYILTLKRQQGVVGFHDALKMAVITLQENRALRRYYKRRFRYVMIDEFQDNNLLQKQLLYLIAEKEGQEGEGIPGPGALQIDKLYFVGDEKQSIYRFRGADVSVFKALSRELMGAGGQSIPLVKNYRSDPELIAFFNALFDQIMGNSEKPYEAAFEPLEPGSPEASASRSPGGAEIKVLHKPYEEVPEEGSVHSDDAEAYYIARLIRQAVEDKRLMVKDAPSDSVRPAEYTDFALIMRSTGNQIRYERAFRIQGVPYATQGVRSLFLEAPFNDFYSLFQCVVYPEDRAAWAAYLRSPFLRMSDDAVIRILLSDQPPFPEEDGVEAELSSGEREKYRNGRDIYRYVMRWRDRKPIADLVRDLWFPFGYRFSILQHPANHGFLEYYDYLAELAREFDDEGKSLALFLDFLRPNLGNYERIPDLSIIKEQTEGVQLVTIHKAKGLEYPIVILCNTGSVGMGDRTGKNPCYLSERFGLTFNLKTDDTDPASRRNYFYSMGEEENRLKEAAELKRLLYVALTRARHHLYISGCHHRNNRNQENIHLNMVLQQVDPKMIETIPSVAEADYFRKQGERDDTDIEEICRKYSQAGIVIHPGVVNRYAVTQLEATTFPEEKGEIAGIVDTIVDNIDELIDEKGLHALFGTLCHYVLQNKIEGRFDPAAIPFSIRENIGGELFNTLLSAALRFSDLFFASEIGGEMRGAEEIETEIPFVYRWGEKDDPVYFHGRIDLLFQTADRACVVDFKTDRTYSPYRHSVQIEIYRRAAEELTGRPTQGVLFYVRDGTAVEPDSGGAEERVIKFLETARKGKREE